MQFLKKRKFSKKNGFLKKFRPTEKTKTMNASSEAIRIATDKRAKNHRNANANAAGNRRKYVKMQQTGNESSQTKNTGNAENQPEKAPFRPIFLPSTKQNIYFV